MSATAAYDPARFAVQRRGRAAPRRRIPRPASRSWPGGSASSRARCGRTRTGATSIFSDIPGDELKRWTPAGGVDHLPHPQPQRQRQHPRPARGACSAASTAGAGSASSSATGGVDTLVDAFEGKRLNSPNDVVVKSDGTVWFTDPPYGLPRQPEGKEQARNNVFRFDPASGDLRAVVDDFHRPNGLCFSPDERRLYIADSGDPHHVRVFDVQADGTAQPATASSAPSRPASRTACAATRPGASTPAPGTAIHIFTPDGDLIGKIITPDAPGRFDPRRSAPRSPANLCFGGPDGTTLFITACTAALHHPPPHPRRRRPLTTRPGAPPRRAASPPPGVRA